MKLQFLISMLISQLKEEEQCHEVAITNQRHFQARDIERRIESLQKAISKMTACIWEKENMPAINFQLL